MRKHEIMKATKSTICVVTQNPEHGENIKAVLELIGTYRCVVASSTQCLRRISEEQEVIGLLVDRSLNTAELDKLVRLAGEYDCATFGTAGSDSNALVKIESESWYQLRHPLGRKDVARLFDHLTRNAESKPRMASGRSKILCRGLVGDSEAVRQVRELIRKIAPSKANILITGETGSGKEIVARNIHYHSNQRSGPFVPINCSAIPPDLLESELFGHKKGAFTGAISNHDGRFVFAADGTLFLDEIGDMSPALQVKMLRVLEERIIHRVGCNKLIPMTARLVAATHRNLEQSVEDGTFREDLYYRLNVVPITVPSLRERKEDISQLVGELAHRLQREQGLNVDLTPAAIVQLQAHNWPGNVRELANLVERLAVIHPNGTADVIDLPDKYRFAIDSGADNTLDGQAVLNRSLIAQVLPIDGLDLKDYLRSTEAAMIRQALNSSNGAMTQAAALLQIGRTTLIEKVKRLGLSEFVKTAG